MSQAYDIVRFRYGLDIADDLLASGLLAPDLPTLRATDADTPNATHWQLTIKTSDGKPCRYNSLPYGLRTELKGALRECGHAEFVSANRALVRRYGTMASGAGLSTKVTAMVLTEAE